MSAETIREFHEFIPDTNHFDPFDSGEDRRHAGELLADVLADKGIPGAAIGALADREIAGTMLSRYSLGEYPLHGDPVRTDPHSAFMNTVAAFAAGRVDRHQPSFTGTPYENQVLTKGSYGEATLDSLLRTFRRNGASREFRTGLVDIDRVPDTLNLPYVPIAVVGAGASGILTARALVEAGFKNVRIIDKRGEVAGLWRQDNVRQGTKNNPFAITFDSYTVGSARDLAKSQLPGSGRHIEQFVHDIALRSSHPQRSRRSEPLAIEKGAVRSIEPGDLNHVMRISQGANQEEIQEFPIVVYAPGIGEPLPVSHTGHMTSPATRSEAGIRWQQQLSDEKLRDLAGKRLIFIGLGNSTAEMVSQLQDYEHRTGRVIDYRIMTHYPQETLHNPHDSFGGYGKLYRDISKPELTKLAGDLPYIDAMYNQAYAEGKIAGEVVDWHVENGIFTYKNQDSIQVSMPYDQIYTLTGYRQNPHILKEMGIQVLDEYTGTIAYDYDGEIQARPQTEGRARLHPGYFAIGPILKNVFNPNAVVIPGIQGQLNRMLPTLLLRATEYALAYPGRLADISRRKQAASVKPTPPQLYPGAEAAIRAIGLYFGDTRYNEKYEDGSYRRMQELGEYALRDIPDAKPKKEHL